MPPSIKSLLQPRLFLLVLLSAPAPADSDLTAIARLVDNVRNASYPQLKDAEISFRDLRNDSVYLETRFTMTSYFFSGRLRYMLFFNQDAVKRHVPAEGLRAILAHELAHIDYFQNQSRMGLAGLIRLLSPSFNTRFERNADLKAIALGYGPGLEAYRRWLYRNIPTGQMLEKKRNYFSPEEIGVILRLQEQRPGFMAALIRCVPRNAAEINALARDPHMKCSD
jgi:hypothetical protein